MKSVILILTSDHAEGYGDYFFALKFSEQFRQYFSKSTINQPLIYIITGEKGKCKIQHLNGDHVYDAQVFTLSELEVTLKTQELHINEIFEGPPFSNSFISNIDKILKANTKVTLTMIQEYGCHDAFGMANNEFYINFRTQPNNLTSIKFNEIINTGFSREYNHNQQGILINQSLVNSEQKKEKWVKYLDHKLLRHILDEQDFESYLHKNELFLQYSQDTDLSALYNDKFTPALHFLEIHREFVKRSSKNQTIIMIGQYPRKRQALSAIKQKLIDDGYTYIIFKNLDKDNKKIVFETENSFRRTYQIIFTSTMPHKSMLACVALSGVIIGVTGDQSFSEAISNKKILVCEHRDHKKSLISSYYNLLIESTDNNVNSQQALNLLSKPILDDKEYEDLGNLLRNKDTEIKLTMLNNSIIENFDLFKNLTEYFIKQRKDKINKSLNSMAYTLGSHHKDQDFYKQNNQEDNLRKFNTFKQTMHLLVEHISYNQNIFIGFILFIIDNIKSKDDPSNKLLSIIHYNLDKILKNHFFSSINEKESLPEKEKMYYKERFTRSLSLYPSLIRNIETLKLEFEETGLAFPHGNLFQNQQIEIKSEERNIVQRVLN